MFASEIHSQTWEPPVSFQSWIKSTMDRPGPVSGSPPSSLFINDVVTRSGISWIGRSFTCVCVSWSFCCLCRLGVTFHQWWKHGCSWTDTSEANAGGPVETQLEGTGSRFCRCIYYQKLGSDSCFRTTCWKKFALSPCSDQKLGDALLTHTYTHNLTHSHSDLVTRWPVTRPKICFVVQLKKV